MTTSKKIKAGILISSLVLLAIIIFQNTGEITTKLLFAEVRMPQAMLLLLTSAFGFLLGFIMAFAKANKTIAKKI